MLRYRPDLAAPMVRQRRDWVFLFESSGDRDPLLARAQIELVRSLLANAEHDDTIAVLAAGTRAHAFAPAPVPNTPENAAAAVAFLEQAHLIGALDLGTAFDKARDLLAGAANPHLVHVGGGQAVIGDSRAAELVRRLPAGTRYVGVAVGKRWNRDLMKQSAERTGGYFTQVNPDEPLAWRGFDLLATLNTPRLFDVTVEPLANRRREPPVAASQQGAHAPRSPQFLGCAESLAQGEELCAMARVGPDAPALRLPEAVRVRGTLGGRPWEQVLPVEAVAPGADYLPRTWAKLEIDRLLAEDAARHKPAIIELSKAMYVMTPFTSLLVLENEQMYKEFKVDRGRKDHWAMYPCPPALNPKPAYEPDPNHPELTPAAVLRNGQKPHASRVMQSIVTRTPRSFLVDPSEAARRALEGMEDRFLGEQGEEFGLDLGLPSPVRFDSPIVTSTITATGLATTRAGQNLHFFATHDINGLGSRLDGTQPKTMWAVAPVMLGNGRVRDQREHMLFEGLNDSGLEGRAVTSANPLTLDSDPILIAIARDTLAKARKQAIYAEAANSKKYLAAVDFAEQNNDLYFLATNGPADGLHLGMIEGKPRATLGFMNGPSGVVTGITPAGFGGPNGFTSDLDIPLHSSSFNYAVPPFGGFPNSPRRNGAPPLYHRPEFSNDARIFSDLPSYAPGLNTSRADVAAAVEAEAAPRFGARLGRVDPAARALIDAARRGTWQTVTVPAGGLPLTILCDGAGRFTYERTLPLGLREQVVCDGTTLWHLYPEIGLAARRSVSRFHRAEFAAVVPTVVPPADDLAHGADVLPGPDGRTVVIRPHLLADADGNQRPAPVELHLVFADAGSLAERRLVEAATGKPLLTEQYRADGIVLLDAAGKEVRRRAFPRGLGLMPDLRPDTAGLVVVPMPFRSREHVYARLDMVVNQSLTGGVNGCFEYLPPGKALDLFVAECAAGEGGRARDVFRGCFEQKDDRRLGFYTLLAMAGHSFDDDPDALRELASHADSPLARYLGLHALPLNQFFQQTLGLTPPASADQDGSLLRRLLVFRSLLWRWSREPGWADLLTRDADARRGLAFVARHRTSPLGWALLGKMQDHGGTPEFFRGLAAEWAELAKVSPYPYAARYERANCLAAGGNRADAVREFQALYGQALAAGVLPPLNSVLRSVLQGQPGDSDEWAVLMRRTAEQLIAAGRRPAAVRLAWQCQTVGDAPLAENLVRLALTGDLPPDERRQTTLAALEFRWATEQLAEAEQLLQSLLTDSELAKVPALWRLASTLADRRGNEPGSLAALETALDLEYAHLPESVAVEPLRRDYAQLLGHYQKLAGAAAELHTKPPADLAARAVRAADRWRALDPEKETVCNLAAGVLRSLGERELAWDYQTTPRAGQPTEAGHWLGTAQGFRKQGDADLAERAFAAATATDPDHAEALWERAQNLRQAGRTDEADRLLRRLADQDWPAARGIREQARWWLQGK
jgi:tetratricopeptide (TPR) repeat protein